jgi:hypothetical protein
MVHAKIRQYVKTHVDGHLLTSGPQVLLFDKHGRLHITTAKQGKEKNSVMNMIISLKST